MLSPTLTHNSNMALNSRSSRQIHSGLPFPPLVSKVEPLLKKLLLVDRLNAVYEEAKAGAQGGAVFQRMLDALQIGYRVEEGDLAKVPPKGPVIAVANHPFGIVDGAILAALLSRIRPDVRIMTTFLVSAIASSQPEDLFLWVDPFGRRDSALANRSPMRAAVEWVRGGGMLVVFPAGEVAHFDWRKRQAIDSAWGRSIAALIRLAGAPALPIFFHGTNSVPFHMLGLVHPILRTLCLAHEFFNKRGRQVQVQIGSEVPFARLSKFECDHDMSEYLYRRTLLLANRSASATRREVRRLPQAIVEAVDPTALAAEVEELGTATRLAEFDDYVVYCTTAEKIPSLLREIGRLREVSFRAVGEGTGLPLDLDEFDQYYEHLFVWHKARRELVGAYRLGRVDKIIEQRGIHGLYTTTLFEFGEAFLKKLGPAVELGRSFVRPEYQRSFSPLLMLWKGIGAWLVRSPQYRMLFGAVSISDTYCAASKQYMVRFLKSRCLSPDLARLVRPKRAFKQQPTEQWELEVTNSFIEDIEDLSALVSEMEADHKGVPILVRQYLKLGGKLIEFNVDPKFSGALDGLIVVDLQKTERRMLERYMGKENAARFFGAQPLAIGA